MTAPTKPKPLINSTFDRGFWEGVEAGKLLIARCPETGVYSFPPSACGRSGGPSPEMVEASGRGSVYTFVVYHRPYHPAWAAELPYVVAWVMLEEGVIMLAQLVGVAPATVAIGMEVEVLFDRIGDRSVPRFAPVSA